MDSIPLAEMLVGLRKELLEAQQKAKEAQLKFKIEHIEVELKVGSTKMGVTGGGVKFWVVDAKAEGSITAEALQTVRMKLLPVAESGEDTYVSDQEKK